MDAIVDEQDKHLLSEYHWLFDKDGYVVATRKINGKTQNFKLHQLILGKKEGRVIDHINNNKLDNRRTNLRHITRQANAMNMKKERGVYFFKTRNKWIAQIKYDGKNRHIGCYDTKEEAIQARKEAERTYFTPYMEV